MVKRLLTGIVALGFLLACYAVYISTVGHFANLEPLRGSFGPDNRSKPFGPDDDPATKPDFARNLADRVFGPDSWQAKADIALYWMNRGDIIYVKDYQQVSSHKLQLVPFSLVHIERSKAESGPQQIATLQGREAVLEFDRPIDLLQMAGLRPIGGKITGDVQIQVDRGTPDDPKDDFVAYTDYLEFDEKEHRVWTDGPVRIVGPDTVATGTGGELLLKTTEVGKKRGEKQSFEGARLATLLRDVEINLLAASTGGLLSGPAGAGDGAKPDKKPESKKTPIRITCQGPFAYDIENSTAKFTRAVQMQKETDDRQFDWMLCDELLVSFERGKTGSQTQPANADDASALTFRAAHATGTTVRVYSDAQATEAIGNELIHDAASGKTILRGEPEVVATQGGNIVHGRELQLTNTDSEHLASVNGPGWMEARDKETGEITLQARWKEWARVEPQGDQQLLVLKGDVAAEQRAGHVTAERLKIWLGRSGNAETAVAPGMGLASNGRSPTRIEAANHVVAESEQFHIEASDHLEMVFQDSPAPVAEQSEKTEMRPSSPLQSKPAVPATKPNTAVPAQAAGAADHKPEPSRLYAQTVRVKVLRDGPKNELSEVWTEGGVEFHQPPEQPGSSPTIVHGDTLNLKRVEQGSQVKVTGRPAHVETPDLKLDGLVVVVDQPTGVAYVDGPGVMTLPAEAGLDGQKLDAPTELVVRWEKSMFFDGSVAEFVGNVQAQQGVNTLRCRQLEAFLSERIDISDPKRKAQSPARIEKLSCIGAVRLDNRIEKDGIFQKLDHLEAERLEANNTNGRIKATGPGLVRSYSHDQGAFGVAGPNEQAEKPRGQKPASKPESSLYLTEVRFAEGMDGDQKQQTATFTGHVAAIHAPVASERELVDANKLPPGGLWIQCEKLEIGSKTDSSGTVYHDMLGTGNVDVEAQGEFYGRSDLVSYNQSLDRIKLEGSRGRPASLYQQVRRGDRPGEAHGEKIWYWRREGRLQVEKVTELDLIDPRTGKKEAAKGPVRK